mgnify:CR=1 FL=1
MELKEFTEIIKNNNIVVADMSASWCGPCKALAPIIDELETEFTSVTFLKLDADEDNEVCLNYKIRNVPTVLFFKNGEVVSKLVGLNKKESYTNTINELLK